MTDYYVKSAGSDGAAGTSDGTAWATFYNWNILFNAGNINPGDTLNLNRGDTWTFDPTSTTTVKQTSLWAFGSSGTAENPIIIQAYGTGARPILDKNGETDTNGLIWAWDAASPTSDYVTVRDLEFTGSGAGEAGISICNGGTGWLIDDIYAHDYSGYGGVHLRGDSADWIIQNSTFENGVGEGIYIGNSSDFSYDTNILIDNCTFTSCFEGVDLKEDTIAVTIQNCTFDNCGGTGGECIMVGGKDHVIKYNIFTDAKTNTRGIYLNYWSQIAQGRQGAENIRIERNLFDNVDGTAYGAIVLNGKNAIVVRNTFANNTNAAILLNYISDTTIGNTHVTHNLRSNAFYNNTYDVYLTGPATTSKYIANHNSYDGTSNVWYWNGSTRAFSYVQGTLGYEANGITGAQGFVDTVDFELDTGSDLIDAGTTTDTTTPYTGAAPDIGYYETTTDAGDPAPAGPKMAMVML